jgi:hypothetical protein
MEVQDYTFRLDPGDKTRYVAGPYDPKTRSPHYTIEIDVPKHIRGQVEYKQFLVGTEGKREWGWDIKNNSSWLAFIIIRKDGEVMSHLRD